MASELSKTQAIAFREHFSTRQREILALTQALVEAESPSGDASGSHAVVSLMAAAARHLSSVTSVDLIPSESFGDHLRIRAFNGTNHGAPIVILGHTDTVHPRG